MIRGRVLMLGTMVLFILGTVHAGWVRPIDLRLTVTDPNGKPVPQFEATGGSGKRSLRSLPMVAPSAIGKACAKPPALPLPPDIRQTGLVC